MGLPIAILDCIGSSDVLDQRDDLFAENFKFRTHVTDFNSPRSGVRRMPDRIPDNLDGHVHPPKLTEKTKNILA